MSLTQQIHTNNVCITDHNELTKVITLFSHTQQIYAYPYASSDYKLVSFHHISQISIPQPNEQSAQNKFILQFIYS